MRGARGKRKRKEVRADARASSKRGPGAKPLVAFGEPEGPFPQREMVLRNSVHRPAGVVTQSEPKGRPLRNLVHQPTGGLAGRPGAFFQKSGKFMFFCFSTGPVYAIISVLKAGTLVFSGVPAFFVTNPLLVQFQTCNVISSPGSGASSTDLIFQWPKWFISSNESA